MSTCPGKTKRYKHLWFPVAECRPATREEHPDTNTFGRVQRSGVSCLPVRIQPFAGGFRHRRAALVQTGIAAELGRLPAKRTCREDLPQVRDRPHIPLGADLIGENGPPRSRKRLHETICLESASGC